jgi:hypothetical protein
MLDPAPRDLTPDQLAAALVQSVRDMVAPLAHLTDAQLEALATGRKVTTNLPHNITPPMARLQLRLRAILAEHGGYYRQRSN